MKKSLFFFVLALLLFPVALKAQNSAKAVVVDSLSVCDSLKWQDGKTYVRDTNLFHIDGDTMRILVLTIRHSSAYMEPAATMGCVYNWRGRAISTSGLFSDTLRNANAEGCDSIIYIALSKTGMQRDTLDPVTACVSYTWKGKTLTADGYYSDTTVVARYNCDSVVVLPLTISTIIPFPVETVEHCGAYVWRDSTYTASGTYVQIRSNTAIACDSIFTLALTMDTIRDTLTSVSSCDQYVWTIGSESITAQDSGLYQISSTDPAGCITIKYRQINVVPLRNVQDTIDTVRCNTLTYRFTGDPIRATYRLSHDTVIQKLFQDHSVSVCRDSLSVVNCIIKPVSRRSDTIDACDSYAWGENTYTISTQDSAVYYKGAANGCDSIQRMYIRITPSPVITAIGGDLTMDNPGEATIYAICDQSNAEFVWDLPSGASYEGDTVTIPVTTNTDILLTVTNPASGCYIEQWLVVLVGVGIDGTDNTAIRLYPNPTTSRIMIESDNAVREAVIYNAIGQRVSSTTLEGRNYVEVEGLANGTYTLQLRMQNGETMNRKFVVAK